MIGFHTSEIQLWSAVSRGQKPLNRQIRALLENFKASSSEAWTTWTVGVGTSLTIWAGACPPEVDEPTAIFAKLRAIFYLPKQRVRIRIIKPAREEATGKCDLRQLISGIDYPISSGDHLHKRQRQPNEPQIREQQNRK